MKKNYLKPSIKVIRISPLEILAGSDKTNETEKVNIYFDDDKTIDGDDAW